MTLSPDFNDPRWVRTALQPDTTGFGRQHLLIVWRGQSWLIRYHTLRLDQLWSVLEGLARDHACPLTTAVTRSVFADVARQTYACACLGFANEIVLPAFSSKPISQP